MNHRVTFASVLLLVLITACAGQETEASRTIPTAEQGTGQAEAPVPETGQSVQVIEIKAGAMGFHPERIELQAGVPVRLIFTRTVQSPCLEQVHIPGFGIEKTDLPLHEPVVVEFTPQEEGTFAFACGMDMQSGTIVVKS